MPYNNRRSYNYQPPRPRTTTTYTGPSTQRHHFTSGTQFSVWFTTKREVNGPMRSYSGSIDAEATTGHFVLTHGSEKNLEQAQALQDELALEVPTPRKVWEHDVQGAFIDAGRLATGQPDMMYNQHYAPSDRTPLRVWVGLTSQWDITNELLTKRGAVLAAFALAMSNIRPVVITPYLELASWDGYPNKKRIALLSWDISTSPLVLAELMIISQPEVTRYFGIEACRQAFGPVAEDDSAFHPDCNREAKMREHLNAHKNDLFLPSIRTRDPMLTDPIAWINEKVTRYTSGETTDITLPESMDIDEYTR